MNCLWNMEELVKTGRNLTMEVMIHSALQSVQKWLRRQKERTDAMLQMAFLCMSVRKTCGLAGAQKMIAHIEGGQISSTYISFLKVRYTLIMG